MRENKYRAWVKRKNELMYLKGFRYSGNEKIKITFADEDCDDCTYTFLKKDVILEQFTGLHDKNGVDIYECDIVKGSIQCGINNAYGVGEVHWSYDYCGWLLTITNDGSAMYEVSMDEIGALEVIGNINENPDLLEDKA